jgi:hypothetical protein
VIIYFCMKKITLLMVVVLMAFLLTPKVMADTSKVPQIKILAQGQVINKDYLAVGEVVDIFGTVNGDAYVAGGQVEVAGIINGDLLVAGGKVKVTGKVLGNIRATGGQIYLTGATVGKNVTLAGGDLESDETTKIAGSVIAAGGNINLASSVGRGINLAGGNVSLNSKIAGDTQIVGDVIRINPKANLLGTFDYWSQNEPLIDSGAVIKGATTKHNLPTYFTSEQGKALQKNARDGALRAKFGFSFFSFLSFLVVGLIISKLFPAYSVKVSQYIRLKPWKALVYGLLVSILTPIALLLVAITIIGIPLVGIVFALFMVFSYIAKYFTIITAGEWLLTKLNQKHNLYFAFVTGLIILYVGSAIPFVGWIFKSAFSLIGFGALVITLYGNLQTKKI